MFTLCKNILKWYSGYKVYVSYLKTIHLLQYILNIYEMNMCFSLLFKRKMSWKNIFTIFIYFIKYINSFTYEYIIAISSTIFESIQPISGSGGSTFSLA